MICLVNKKSNSKTKNWLLAPNIKIFGSKLHFFVPSGQLEPHWSMFENRCFNHFRWSSFPRREQDFWSASWWRGHLCNFWRGLCHLDWRKELGELPQLCYQVRMISQNILKQYLGTTLMVLWLSFPQCQRSDSTIFAQLFQALGWDQTAPCHF